MVDDPNTSKQLAVSNHSVRVVSRRHAVNPLSDLRRTNLTGVADDHCHRGLVGYTLECRNDDGSVITWAELSTSVKYSQPHQNGTVQQKQTGDCDLAETGNKVIPWLPTSGNTF